MSKRGPNINHARVDALAKAILQPLASNYTTGPDARTPERVYEMLNVLGVGLAAILAGLGRADERARARRFFNHCVRVNLEELWRRGKTLQPEDWPHLHGGPGRG